MLKDDLEIRGYGNMNTYGYIKHNEMSGYAIVHHGIKGMKWGVRRYQNEDGSLTEAGKRRYNKDSDYLAKSLYDAHLARLNYDDKAEKFNRIIENRKKEVKEANKDSLWHPFKKEEIVSMPDLWKTPEGKATKAAKNQYIRTLDNIPYIRSDLMKKYLWVETSNPQKPLIDEKTGKKYVRALLKTKAGKEYVSEFYV